MARSAAEGGKRVNEHLTCKKIDAGAGGLA
jgi:hypothetical protein